MQSGIIWCPHCRTPHPIGTKVCPKTAKSLDRDMNKKADHPLVGKVIGGKYVVTKLLGIGGMGAVFEAENRLLRRMVAIKLVDATATRDAVARLEREAVLVSAVQHPNICDVYDVGVLPDGSPFIVLERLFGETLAKVIKRKGTLAADVVFDIFTQLLSGLQAAHGASIVHRDLKPENVFLVDRLGIAPLVKILDFGFAKDISGLRVRSNTQPGKVLGTLRYLAPEVIDRQPADHRTDLFGVGLMLYESLVGKPPFDDPLQKVEIPSHQIAHQLRSARADLPPSIGDLVGRSLARDMGKRFQSAREFQLALSAAFGREPLRIDSLPPGSRIPDSR